ncbi:hypothetical protein SAMN05444007_102100 [Cribrihabitans marinus]|uniref:Beta-lactamase-related domain-containing protein n=1 Tax=Cribrihabitans marinus TaxID=1227549 RepID=A0A1H6SGZ2_9RHOB|nr:serine hydrolase [Cribrihabitans marinus]GGH23390.1 hypothetical protein GCM10010973_09250 [Cribrihabitans marinus]SEI67121.1 hypothetical protein SAMN05444007_102100 [Cribrihabitans marinus]
MRIFGKWLGRVLLLLILAAVAVGIWKREEIERLIAVNSLFDADVIVENFSNMDRAFLTVDLPRGDGPTSDLPYGGPAYDLPDAAGAWISERALTSLLVLKAGEIRYEEYFLGTGPDDRRISWSIAKSYLSALFGTVLAEGAIDSLDDPVIRYAPELADSAYAPASIRDVLNMASGVKFDEDYLDYNSDINRMGRVVALGRELDDFTAALDARTGPPGEAWTYVSIDTHVVGMVIRGATGRSVTELMTQRIVQPLGLERDGYYITDGAGVAFVLGGLNFTTRDYARFGVMIEQDGRRAGTQIVPADWIADSTRPSAPTAPGKTGYGFQWWIPVGAEEGEFYGRGVYGQYLYIDQARDVVIVVTAADRKFRDPGVNAANIEMLRKIAQSL